MSAPRWRGCSTRSSKTRPATRRSISSPVSDALIYAVFAALGNVGGALAVSHRMVRVLLVIEHAVAFGAGFMLAVAIIEILPQAFVRLLLHQLFDGVAIASAFLVRPSLGVMVFLAILIHKLPEGVTIARLSL